MSFFLFPYDRLANKKRNYEESSKYKIHLNGRAKAVEDYKKKLPIGMAPVPQYVDFLRTQPYPPFLAVSS